MLLFDMTNVLFVFPVYSQKRSDDKKDEAEFVCPEGQGNGNFADPATCRRFYQVLLHAHHSILTPFIGDYEKKVHFLCDLGSHQTLELGLNKFCSYVLDTKSRTSL